MKIDKKLIKELTAYLDEFGLTEIEYGNQDLKIRVSKSNKNDNSNKITEKIIDTSKPNNKSESSVAKITSPIIELHISNIYKREEFRRKSLISDIATGGIFGLGDNGYILAIISMQNILQNEIR